MKIIVGLGNPGKQYEHTRHNAGWLALDSFLGEVKWTESKRFSALTYADGDYLYVKPLTFMNNSGQAVQKIMNYYKLLPKSFGLLNKKDADLREDLLVVHDELDLPFGEYRVSVGSGSAGHRGVESIINYLKTKNFRRLRLGIKNDLLRTHIPPDKFVLAAFSPTEREALKNMAKTFDLRNLK